MSASMVDCVFNRNLSMKYGVFCNDKNRYASVRGLDPGRGVYLRTVRKHRFRDSAGHGPPESLSGVPVEPARRSANRRPPFGLPGPHGTDRRVGAERRRMGYYSPVPELWPDPDQPDRGRRQRSGPDVTRRPAARAAAVSVASAVSEGTGRGGVS